MQQSILLPALGGWLCCVTLGLAAEKKEERYSSLPKPGTLLLNKKRGEVILPAIVRHPRGKPCIDDFALERVLVDGKPVEKPWTPHFVFHGSGAIHKSGTGCIACPCDCAGGIIADNRFPLYNPKPIVRFNWKVAPKVGTQVYVRIRPVSSR